MLQMRKVRRERGLSQVQVADLTGIAQSDISAIERGVKPIYPSWRERLSRLFGVCEERLFAPIEEDDETRPDDRATSTHAESGV